MRIVVDFDVCEANAICMGIAPEVFEVDDDENLNVLMIEPPEELRELMLQAVRACPKRAIAIQD
jgi:ferredoxin